MVVPIGHKRTAARRRRASRAGGCMSLIIGGIEVVPDSNIIPRGCRFVVEISNAHNGSYDRAIRLIDAAKDAGADFVKTQAFTVDELCALRGEGTAPVPWGNAGWTM